MISERGINECVMQTDNGDFGECPVVVVMMVLLLERSMLRTNAKRGMLWQRVSVWRRVEGRGYEL